MTPRLHSSLISGCLLSRSGVRETHPETDGDNSGCSGLKEAEEALLGKETPPREGFLEKRTPDLWLERCGGVRYVEEE